MAVVNITTPLNKDNILLLKAGDRVFISGNIYTSRDAVHKKYMKLIKEGKKFPIDLKDQIIYYTGPAPARPGQIIGPTGPTTSGRMDIYTPTLLQTGIAGCIGKGSRSQEVKDALKKYTAVYFAAIGGIAALLSKTIIEAEVVAYPELGPEAIYRFKVHNFPTIVINDAFGNDHYQDSMKKYRNMLC